MSLFENYEQHFSSLTADISHKIGRIPNLNGDEKKAATKDCERNLEDVKELIEQMDLEVRDAPASTRAGLTKKLNNYNSEYQNLESNLRKSRVALMDSATARTRLLGSDEDYYYTSEDQRTRLLENSERIEKSNNRLDDGLRIALETEQVGADIMTNLENDREKIKRSRDRLRGINQDLSKSNRVLQRMYRRAIQHKIVVAIIVLVIIGIIILIIYFAVTKK